jgi:uncharacterized NAD(P)/FAD-binding protein YdhS
MRTVVVIGGGCSGVFAALHLLRTGAVSVALVEPSRSTGQGLAYSPPTRDFLLNVPAARMSAWTDRAGDFLEWLRRTDPSADAATFAPRAAYGDYLADLVAGERSNPRLDLVRDRAIDTAVPELRGQAAAIAAAVAESARDPGADLRPHPGPDTITGPCSAQPVAVARVLVPGP